MCNQRLDSIVCYCVTFEMQQLHRALPLIAAKMEGQHLAKKRKAELGDGLKRHLYVTSDQLIRGIWCTWAQRPNVQLENT